MIDYFDTRQHRMAMRCIELERYLFDHPDLYLPELTINYLGRIRKALAEEDAKWIELRKQGK